MEACPKLDSGRSSCIQASIRLPILPAQGKKGIPSDGRRELDIPYLVGFLLLRFRGRQEASRPDLG